MQVLRSPDVLLGPQKGQDGERGLVLLSLNQKQATWAPDREN